MRLNLADSWMKLRTMSINTQFRADLKSARKLRLPWWALVVIIVFSIVSSALADHAGDLSFVLPALNGLAVIGFLIYVKRDLMDRGWFWVAIALFAAIHAALVWRIPWATGWTPAFAIAVIDSLDFCFMLWVIDAILVLAGRRTEG